MCIFSVTNCADRIRNKYLDNPSGYGRTDISSFLYTQLINLVFTTIFLLIFMLS